MLKNIDVVLCHNSETAILSREMGKYIEGRKSLEVSVTLSYFLETISRIEVGVLKTPPFFFDIMLAWITVHQFLKVCKSTVMAF